MKQQFCTKFIACYDLPVVICLNHYYVINYKILAYDCSKK